MKLQWGGAWLVALGLIVSCDEDEKNKNQDPNVKRIEKKLLEKLEKRNQKEPAPDPAPKRVDLVQHEPKGWMVKIDSSHLNGEYHPVAISGLHDSRVLCGVTAIGDTMGPCDIVLTNDGAWLVGRVGEVMRVRVGKDRPESYSIGTTGVLQGVYAPPSAGVVWICGADNVNQGSSIWHSADDGRTWKIQFNTAQAFPNRSLLACDRIHKFWFAPSGVGWAVGGLGDNSAFILKTTDGVRWKVVYRDYTTGRYDMLHGICFSDDRRGFAVGNHGAALFTLDGGETWDRVNLPVKEHLLNVRCADAKRWWIVGQVGVALRTEDGGEQWDQVQIPGVTAGLQGLSMVRNHVWLGGDGGLILYSADAGRTWTRQQSNTSHPVRAIVMANEKIGVAVCAGTTSNMGALLATLTGGN